MNYLIYIVLGLAPGIIWLLFYLKKDKKPEPKSMVIKIFIWGMMIAPLVVVVEMLIVWLLVPSSNPAAILFGQYETGLLQIIIIASFVPALAEEYFKYAVVKTKILKHSVFDEPTDAMIYCIISGLGFASVENLLAVFNFSGASLGNVIGVITLRFLGATLLHALASATVGYYLALSIFHLRKAHLFQGLSLAIVLHTCYNYLILTASVKSGTYQQVVIILIAALLIVSATYVSNGFRNLKKYQSICKI